jgi:hypothetical protein
MIQYIHTQKRFRWNESRTFDFDYEFTIQLLPSRDGVLLLLTRQTEALGQEELVRTPENRQGRFEVNPQSQSYL